MSRLQRNDVKTDGLDAVIIGAGFARLHVAENHGVSRHGDRDDDL